MEEYIYQIRKYLPIKFADNEANEFLKYLEETYLENIKNKKYQFSFCAFHMLYMAFIYKVKWFLKQRGNTQIENDLQNHIKKNEGVVFNSLFDLSQIPEKTSLEKLLRALTFHVNEIHICTNHVNVRNNCLHSSGKIYYKKTSRIEPFIEEEIEYIEKIQGKIIMELKHLLEQFIDENWNKNYISGDIQIWVQENYISEKDLELITNIDLPLFKDKSDNEEVVFQKILYLLFIYESQKHFKPEKNIFLEKLPMFMIGLKEEIKVQKDKEEKIVSTQKIIAENIEPIVSEFEKEDREKAEKILKLSKKDKTKEVTKPPLSKPSSKEPLVKFPTPPGTRWEDVRIGIVSNDSIKITAKEVHKRFTYAEIGFKDGRKGDLPDKQWDVLKDFAEANGEISWGSKWTRPRLQKRIQTIRKRLQAIMDINDDPFYPYQTTKSYKTKFKIEDKSYP